MPRKPIQKPLRFYNPFDGTPSPIRISRLFLIHPEVMLKLHGLSFRRLISDEFGDAFYKKYERISQGTQPASSRNIAEFRDRFNLSALPIKDDVDAALNGDCEAQARLDALGPWELHFLGESNDLRHLTKRGWLLIDIERASKMPALLIKDGAILQAVNLMTADPVLSKFLWPDAIMAMTRCKTEDQLLPVLAAVVIEVLLSYLAATDAELAIDDESTFLGLLPSDRVPGKNPTSLFFRYLCDAAGVKSVSKLQNDPRADSFSLDLTTLKRWSAGTHCPDPTWLQPVLMAFFDDSAYPPARRRYWGARYLNLIGYIGQVFDDAVKQRQSAPEMASALLPWPNYPFGHSSCESWMQARYPYWFDYHLARRPRKADGSWEKRPMGLFS